MTIKDLKHSHPKIYESAMRQKHSESTEDSTLTAAFDWYNSEEKGDFWSAVNRKDFNEAKELCPHLFNKFNVGDRVNVPLDDNGGVVGYESDCEGVIHGVTKSVDNVFTVSSYEGDWVIVEYVGRSNNQIVRLGWKEEQLSLYVPEVKEESWFIQYQEGFTEDMYNAFFVWAEKKYGHSKNAYLDFIGLSNYGDWNSFSAYTFKYLVVNLTGYREHKYSQHNHRCGIEKELTLSQFCTKIGYQIPVVITEGQYLIPSSEHVSSSKIIIPKIVRRLKTPLDVRISSIPEINVKLKSTRKQVEKIIIQIPEYFF